MLADLKSAYAGKKVLITGHTGFKGGWLSLWLNKLGAEVAGYSLEPPSSPNLFCAASVEKYVQHHHGDITDLKKLSEVINSFCPDIVFHLAAQPLVRLSYEIPVETYESNVMGTVKVMEAVRINGNVKAFVNITSDKSYENKEWYWGYRENDSFGGDDPYSSSKGCAELVFAAYSKSFFSPEKYGETHSTLCGSVRAGNVIGGGDWGADRLLPDCARMFSTGEKVCLRYPQAIRPWQHALDPLHGYLILGVKLLEGDASFAGGWNFGPSDEEVWTVEQVVKSACDVWGTGSYSVDVGEHLHEARWLKLDCSQARQKLGWKPVWSVKESIKKTVEWYKMYYAGSSEKEMLALTLSQINEFERSILS